MTRECQQAQEHGRFRRGTAVSVAVALALGLAACQPSGTAKAPVETRGTDPNIGAERAGSNTLNNSVVAEPDGNGIITYDGYQSVVARQGDTVADVAARVGLSASELGAYNGLPANHSLFTGAELVLPPRPGGYGPNGGLAAVTAPVGSGANVQSGTSSTIEQREIEPTGTAVQDAGTDLASNNAPGDSGQGQGWSPDLAAAAIDRSTGLQEDGTLAAPPSANDPTPPAPNERQDLSSPDLSQYQTAESSAGALPPPPPDAGATAAGTPDANLETAAVEPSSPASVPNIRMTRPVEGPVAIGFNKGAGPTRNDGVDFAASAGSPVVAAADGEVALVSQSLSGLGTIVLIRHPDEVLTVYGRIADVSVTKGDPVKRGQQIGVVSGAGAPAEPRMHFEVRKGAESLDPMLFLSS